jgi:multiple sugar transport system permease protein
MKRHSPGEALAESGVRRQGASRARKREILYGLFFLSPWALGFTLFVAGPMVASLYLSFTTYNIAHPPIWLGLQNYTEALTKDNLLWGSLGRTLYYAGVAVPLGLVGSLVLALLLTQALRGTNLFRTLFFLPHLTPIVATTLLWQWLLHPEIGVVNYLIRNATGLQGPRWLGSKEWAIPALILMALWRGVGGNRMMIFIAGLQGIEQELYDAAAVDGANSLQRVRAITLPMLTPTIFFNLVLGIIGALKVFTSAFVATKGGPAYATWFYALHIYTHAFEFLRMGYASALAWLLFVVLFAFTYIQFRSSSRWVYYAGEAR